MIQLIRRNEQINLLIEIMVIVDLSCPWELYLFASCHLVMGLVNYLDDTCMLLTSESCTDAELFWERVHAISLVCVGVIVRSMLPTPVRPFCFTSDHQNLTHHRSTLQPYNPQPPTPVSSHCISDVVCFVLFWPIDDSSRFSPIMGGDLLPKSRGSRTSR